MTVMSDDRLDLELVWFLREEADDLYGAPDAEAMTWRLMNADRSLRRRLDRLVARPIVRVALVGLLLAAALGTTLIVGAIQRGLVTNGQVILSPGLVLDTTTGKLSASALCAGRCADAAEVAYSRDGRTLAIVDRDGTAGDMQTGAAEMSVWRYASGSGSPTLLVTCGIDAACGGPSFSVDGKRLAYVEADLDPATHTEFTTTRVIVIDMATGKDAVVPHPPGFPFSLSWTSDGRIVEVNQGPHDRNPRTYVIDPKTGKAVEQRTDKWRFATGSASPDGSQIAFLVFDSGPHSDGIMHPEDYDFDVWLAGVDGADLRHLYRGDPAEFDGGSHPVWSPDGRLLALGLHPIGGDSRVLIIDAENGALMQSFDSPASVSAWSTAG